MASLTVQIEAQIEEVLKKEVARLKEEVVKAAVQQFEKEIREVVGTVAVNVSKFYSMENFGSVLQVRIQTGEPRG